jgi:hypothetical protein
MTTFTENNEMILAVEGARGPPTSKRENFFICTAMIP